MSTNTDDVSVPEIIAHQVWQERNTGVLLDIVRVSTSDFKPRYGKLDNDDIVGFIEHEWSPQAWGTSHATVREFLAHCELVQDVPPACL